MKKILTREQAQTSKDRAARFVSNVLHDPDKAQEIKDESLDDYVERKKITLTNPTRPRRGVCVLIHDGHYKRKVHMAKKSLAEQLEDLKAENADLKAENDDLQDQLDQVADIVAGDEEDDDDAEGEEEDDDQD